ncbi:peptidoglycan DD-metalloendopeptidase family protein [Paraburkholderia fungorum]|uniref:M23 family metallopeptidase n=1 Tax=Paraburkholderia fungorum TaxID=134537 RepID=UPI0038BA18ED
MISVTKQRNGGPTMSFPLPFVPKHDYHTGGRRYGAARPNGRKHAGCDLLAPPGTPVMAVRPGLILKSPYKFYQAKNGAWTYALEVKHREGFVVRYTELDRCADGIKTGVSVAEGQTIGYVGAALMLHFELYAGTEHGPLTDRGRVGFQRRADLLDPTSFLDSLCTELYCKMAVVR